jgi:hypothetical protein
MINQADGSPYLLRLRLGRTWKGPGVVVGATSMIFKNMLGGGRVALCLEQALDSVLA